MRVLNIIFTTVFAFLLVGCPEGETSADPATVQEAVEPEPMIEEKPAVCIWDKGSLRAAPKRDGKWISAMALGEKITWTGHEAVDSTNKDRKYYQVRLSDGTEGWASEYVVALDSEPAVVIAETAIFRRPDYLTVTDNKFAPMDVVAISETRGEWAQVMGAEKKRQGWIETGLISTEPVDIAVGLIAGKAMAISDPEQQREKLQEIIDNQAFGASVFHAKLKDKLDAAVNPDIQETDAVPDSM